MVIWKFEPSPGPLKKRSWRISGETDFGPVVVYATERETVWELLCMIPGWDERGTPASRPIWQGNVAQWLMTNALKVNEDGAVRLRLEKKNKSEEEFERGMSRVATMLASSIMAASFIRLETGMRESFPSAA